MPIPSLARTKNEPEKPVTMHHAVPSTDVLSVLGGGGGVWGTVVGALRRCRCPLGTAPSRFLYAEMFANSAVTMTSSLRHHDDVTASRHNGLPSCFKSEIRGGMAKCFQRVRTGTILGFGRLPLPRPLATRLPCPVCFGCRFKTLCSTSTGCTSQRLKE